MSRSSIVLGLALAMAVSPAVLVSAHTSACAFFPAAHTYVLGAAYAGNDAIGEKSTVSAYGTVVARDGNVADCDNDGILLDYDGDLEQGLNGAFFGYGLWAYEPNCQYDLKTHGATVTVTGTTLPPNPVVQGIAFVTTADDTQGPIIIEDPTNPGFFICVADGIVTPGDPTVDPTADADDCISQIYVTPATGTACGAGGDGGYWVTLLDVNAIARTAPPDLAATNVPLTGTISA